MLIRGRYSKKLILRCAHEKKELLLMSPAKLTELTLRAPSEAHDYRTL